MMVCCTSFAGFQPFYYIRKLRCVRIWWFAAHGLKAFSHLLHQQIENWGNMMVYCQWFDGFQPFYYISKLRCEGICWFSAMVCCKWFEGFKPLYYISILRTGGIWWFAANGWMASNHSTTSANCDVREYDGLLHMVCWFSTILLHPQIEMWENMMVCWAHGLPAFSHLLHSKVRTGEYDGLLHMVCSLSTILLHQQIQIWGNMMVCCTHAWLAAIPCTVSANWYLRNTVWRKVCCACLTWLLQTIIYYFSKLRLGEHYGLQHIYCYLSFIIYLPWVLCLCVCVCVCVCVTICVGMLCFSFSFSNQTD